ncbi:hexokinase-1-like protein isoform X1 [Tanacetum coccineum]
MSAMHRDTSPNLRVVRSILKDTLEISKMSLVARIFIVEVCDIIVTRAARLATAGILGSIWRKHYTILRHIELVHSNDGSGIGAALVGASDSKY